MATKHPINFEEKTKGARGSTNADYPYAIKAQDLMRDFVYAALDAEDGLIENGTGEQGYAQRKLKIRAGTEIGNILIWDGTNWVPLSPPSGSGLHVLASSGGTPFWIETEACE
jgi:hypothetical protein